MEEYIHIWQFIKDCKRLLGNNLDEKSLDFQRLCDHLPEEEKRALTAEYFSLLKEADQKNLWEACSLILGTPCGDDSFEYFLNWLIYQGRHIFQGAIKNADTLSRYLGPAHDDNPRIFIESLGFIGTLDKDFLKKNQPPTWNWKESSIASMSNELPLLWSRFGKRFKSLDKTAKEVTTHTVVIPGMGPLSIGDTLIHKFGNGNGKILSFPIPENLIAEIQFAAETKVMRISSDFFSKT